MKSNDNNTASACFSKIKTCLLSLLLASMLFYAGNTRAHTIAEPGKSDPLYLGTYLTKATHVQTNGAKTGSISVLATGGAAPYNFAINGSSNQCSNTFSNLPAGFYVVTVTDAKGNSCKLPVVIYQPFPENTSSE